MFVLVSIESCFVTSFINIFSRLNEYRPSKKRWDLSRMGKIEKNLYKENPKVAARSDVRKVFLKLLGFLHFTSYVSLSNRAKSSPTVMLGR